MSIIKLLIENNSKYNGGIVDDVVNMIVSKSNIQVDEISDKYNFLDSGSWANVYSIRGDDTKILRIEATDQLMSYFSTIEGGVLDNVVHVFYNKIIDFDEKHVEITVMERLKPLDKYEQQELDYIDEEYDIGDENNLPESWREYSSFEDVVHILIDVYKGVEELERMNIHLNDLHSRNVMYDPKTDKYKIIDLSNF